MIQQTAEIVDGNLRRTPHGFWAEYRVTPLPYGERSYEEKRAVGAAHEQLFSKLIPYSPIVAGFLEPEAPADIARKSLAIGGDDCQQPIDHESMPAYAAMVTDRVNVLEPLNWPRRRVLLVAFPVGKTLQVARRNRAKIVAQLPASWILEPAQSREMLWVWEAAINRGVRYVSSSNGFTSARFDDGAREDGKIDGYNRFKRPGVIKITPHRTTPTYQIVLKAVFPVGEMAFPGSTELFKVLDATGFHVDWVIRCRPIRHAQVVSDNRNISKIIDSNIYETALDPARTDDDAIAQALLDDYDTKIAVNKVDSVWFTVLAAVGGRSLAEAERMESMLSEVTAPMRVKWKRIAGLQQELWSAMLPGNTVHHAVDALGDETDLPGFSELVPFTSSALGSPTGPIFGRNIKSGLNDLFRINTRAILANNLPANLVLLGGLGAGKTTVLMTGMMHDAALGHLFAGYDRTELGELAKVAKRVPGHIILDILRPQCSVDALKTFAHDPAIAGRHALNTLIALLKFETGSEEALALSEALTRDSIIANNITSMAQLQHVLLSGDSISARVGRHLRMWSNYAFTAALFDPELPPVDYGAPAFILRTHGMPAAGPEELYSEHLYRRLSPEKLYIEAMYELTGHALRETYFNRPDYCSIYLPEAWHLTRKPIGREMIEIINHDSRKHGVMLWMDTHLGARDFTEGQTDLIGIWLVGHTEEQAARDNITAAGLSITDNPEFVDDITAGFGVGQFLVRFFDQVGAVQTFLPADAAARAAMDTTFRAVTA